MKPSGTEVPSGAVASGAVASGATESRAAVPAQPAAPALEETASPPEVAASPPSPPAPPALTDRELEILAFEGRWWRHAGAKEQAIRDTFEVSTTRYYQLLNGLLDNPAALAHDPVLVGRLRRLRSTRANPRPL